MRNKIKIWEIKKEIKDLKWIFKMMEEPCKCCGKLIPLRWYGKLWATPFLLYVLLHGVSKEEIYQEFRKCIYHQGR